MKTYKGQVTVNPRLTSYLSDRLDALTSPRERADFIAQAADRYCMLEKFGMIGSNANGTEERSNRTSNERDLKRDDAPRADLGDDFFTRVLSEYMSSPAPKSDLSAVENLSPREGSA
jgi:hypothetical protein